MNRLPNWGILAALTAACSLTAQGFESRKSEMIADPNAILDYVVVDPNSNCANDIALINAAGDLMFQYLPAVFAWLIPTPITGLSGITAFRSGCENYGDVVFVVGPNEPGRLVSIDSNGWVFTELTSPFWDNYGGTLDARYDPSSELFHIAGMEGSSITIGTYHRVNGFSPDKTFGVTGARETVISDVDGDGTYDYVVRTNDSVHMYDAFGVLIGVIPHPYAPGHGSIAGVVDNGNESVVWMVHDPVLDEWRIHFIANGVLQTTPSAAVLPVPLDHVPDSITSGDPGGSGNASFAVHFHHINGIGQVIHHFDATFGSPTVIALADRTSTDNLKPRFVDIDRDNQMSGGTSTDDLILGTRTANVWDVAVSAAASQNEPVLFSATDIDFVTGVGLPEIDGNQLVMKVRTPVGPTGYDFATHIEILTWRQNLTTANQKIRFKDRYVASVAGLDENDTISLPGESGDLGPRLNHILQPSHTAYTTDELHYVSVRFVELKNQPGVPDADRPVVDASKLHMFVIAAYHPDGDTETAPEWRPVHGDYLSLYSIIADRLNGDIFPVADPNDEWDPWDGTSGDDSEVELNSVNRGGFGIIKVHGVKPPGPQQLNAPAI